MRRRDKVAWAEGLFLTPHLFQQETHYHDANLQFRVSAFAPFPFGITELELDREALANGTFSVLRCRGVLADGLVIGIPDGDEPPARRSFAPMFPATAERLESYLCIPVGRPEASDIRVGDGAGSPLRYRLELGRVSDHAADDNDREIPLARKNFRVLFSGESLHDTTSMKIAEIVRMPSGAFALDDTFVPPCLTLSGSLRLILILRRILELLVAKSAGLSQQRRHLSDFGTSDIANFWLLHTVNSTIPVLTHFSRASDRPPEQLYTALVRLAGELSTFTLQADPKDLPRYEHEDLRATFGELERLIVFLLGSVIPDRYVIIPLELTQDLLHVGRIGDDRLLRGAQFYVGAHGVATGGRLMEDLPARTKISAPEQINDLIGRAVPGVTLTHEPVPPSAIPVKAGFKYFQLGTQGRWWDAITRSRALAIYVPDEFRDVKLELVAVKEKD